MSDTPFDLDGVRTQQKTLRQYGQLRWMHWLILAVSVLITIVAWNFSDKMLENRAQSRFEREAHLVVDKIRQRLFHYEDALRAGTATMVGYEGELTRKQWAAYTKALDIPNRYPGVNGIGVIREVTEADQGAFEDMQSQSWPEFKLFPAHTFPIKLPIVYIEPEQDNAAAVGLDVAFEDNRRTAALLARDTATPQMSGPITLVQDKGKTPGFLFYMPFYRNGSGFEGLVYAPLVVKNLVKGVHGGRESHVTFSIEDTNETLYDEFTDATLADATSLHSTHLTETFYGREWLFKVSASSAFYHQGDKYQPLVVLVSGLTIDAMLFGLFLMMSRSNNKVLTLADLMINELGDQAVTLTQKNAELESFAYIASHDLKTPIRAIHALSGFIEEDIDDLVSDADTKQALTAHTSRIKEQVERSTALIKGILNFSIVGENREAPSLVDVSELVHGTRRALGIPEHQLKIVSELPKLDTYSVQLTQVFENLMGNAYKYHPRPDELEITVSADTYEHYYRFHVADNGEGIEEQYHQRVFKPFMTLRTDPSIDSSGIGLSIVKKSVESFGGQVGIDSHYRAGVKFYFDWPIVHRMGNENIKHAA